MGVVRRPTMPQAQLVQFNYKRGSDVLHIQAIVEDAIQVLPATMFDPPEFGSALCETALLWDEPLTPDTVPTAEQVQQMLPWIDDWCVIPPIDFDD